MTMGSPTRALLCDLWRRHRSIFVLAIAVTAIGRLVEAANASVLTEIMRLVSFVLIFGIFSYTESRDGRGLGRFPRRLFVLPVSSLRLVAVPMLAGIAAVESVYLAWLDAS